MPRKYVCPSCKAEGDIPNEDGPPATPETASFDVRGKFSEYDERIANLEHAHEAPAASASEPASVAETPESPPVGMKRGFFQKLDELLDD